MKDKGIQLQEGMSLYEFLEKYGTDEQCVEELARHRWPKGFKCPACGHSQASYIKTRGLYQCVRCDHQTSVTSGTIFHSTKLPLKKWFMAIYLLTQSKNSISSLELKRHIGVTHNTAYRVKQKIMQVMLCRNKTKPIGGTIIVDDSYPGGEKTGKRGRGAAGKTPFIAAVELNEKGYPMRIKLNSVKRFSNHEIAKWSAANIRPGSHITSDGLACFAAVCASGHTHTGIITGSGKAAVTNATFTWVNTILGNIKNSLCGTYHSFDHQHPDRYLAEFEYRFNRRFKLKDMLPRFIHVAARTAPCTSSMLRFSEY